jgi:hypothetical protein
MSRALVGFLFACALAGCSGSGSGASPAPLSSGSLPTSASLPSASAWGGHFIGTVKIGDVEYYGDAVITGDGAIRLYVGGPYASDGTVQPSRPESSDQFVGNLEVHADQAMGIGVILGQQCAPPNDRSGFCSENASAEIHLVQYAIVTAAEIGIRGEMQVTVNEATQIWSLDLAPLGIYSGVRARPEFVQGQYQEVLAEFASDGDTIISVDLAGQLFFQSTHSGCIGNGTLVPHLDGEFDIYDVTLVIASCNAPYDYLNGEFEGLATPTPSSVWDYDSLLRAWLSGRRGTQSLVAVTMLGLPM